MLTLQIIGAILFLVGVFFWREGRKESRKAETDIHRYGPDEYQRGASEASGRGTPKAAPNYATAYHQTSLVWYFLAGACLIGGTLLVVITFLPVK